MQPQDYMNQGIYAAAQRYEAPQSEVLAELDRINERGQLARMEAKANPPTVYTAPETPLFWTVEAKRTAFGTGCLTLVISAAQGALNSVAPWVFGGFVVAFGVPWLLRGFIGGLRECFTWESGTTGGQSTSSGPGGEKWEFYQKQEQGWRKV